MSVPIVNLPLIGMPGLWEWVLIGLAVMLLFGASKLPKLGKGLGEGIRNFKKGLKGEDEEGELAKESPDADGDSGEKKG